MAMTPQQAAAQGLAWVDESHPLYGTPGFVGPQSQAPGATTTPAQPTEPPLPTGTNDGQVSQQAQNAATYSSTPGAAPTQSTTNQGTQDVVRNSYLAQATQGTQVDTTDPNFRQQVAPFAAAVERQKRDFISDQAEALGPTATGALRGQERMAAERAGQAIGGFEAELVGRELQQRRAEIQNALANLGNMVSDDQRRALELQLAEMNDAIARLGIQTSVSEGALDRSLRERLARMSDALERERLAQQLSQWADEFGLKVGLAEAGANQLPY